MTSHATPPGERDLPAGRFAHIKGIVMDEVARTHAPRRAQRRRTVSILAAGLLLAMAVGAGAYVLRPADQFASLGCYSTAARDADVAVVSTDGRDPEDVCAELWASGEVGPTTQVPPLTSCVGEGAGAIWVLPGGRGVCERLGLQRLSSVAVDPDAPSVPELRDALIAHFGGRECIDIERARDIAQAELGGRGFDGWTVEAREFADTDCASFGLDVAEQLVFIIGMPGPDSLQAALGQATAEADCLDAEQASAAARQVLSERGLDDWTVQVEQETFDGNQAAVDGGIEGEVCAQFSAADGVVYVVGVIYERH